MYEPPREPVADRPIYPWYRRYWGYANRPFAGCGCVGAVVLIIIIIIIIFWIIGFNF
jgi:hypothetical protein